MKKYILLFAALLCLAACTPDAPPVTPAAATPAATAAPTAPPINPAFTVTRELTTSVTEVIADYDDYSEEREGFYVVAGDAALRDVLFSLMYEEGGAPVESELMFYVPELAPGQAVRLTGPNAAELCYRIAYTNSDGTYEAQLLRFDETGVPAAPEMTAPNLRDIVLDEDYAFFQPEDFAAKAREGAFDAYLPQGLCIAMGSLGDVNADGIRDALLGLTTAGQHAASYLADTPLFVLLGRPEGGYAIAARATDVLFLSPRSSSQPTAGEGVIELRYDETGGAADHDKNIARFAYDPASQDWLLREISYQPAYMPDYEAELAPAFVRPLPALEGQPLSEFSSGGFYNVELDLGEFDTVQTFTIADNYDFALCLRRNEEAGTYEGYIYKNYQSLNAGDFIQTVRGDLAPGEAWDTAADATNHTFTIQGDLWAYVDHEDAFYLAQP